MTFQEAKDRIASLDPLDFNRPDSLTRRGDTMIARRAFSWDQPRHAIIFHWRANIKELFPEATIIKADVDGKNNARCWIQF